MKKSHFKLWLICRLYGNHPFNGSFQDFQKKFSKFTITELLYSYNLYCTHRTAQIQMGIQEVLSNFDVDLSKYNVHLHQIPLLFLNKKYEEISDWFVDEVEPFTPITPNIF